MNSSMSGRMRCLCGMPSSITGPHVSWPNLFRGRRRIGGKYEADVYGPLGIPVIAAGLREDRGEIEAALEGRLPMLVEIDDLRGDLHAHTNWSDGKSTLEEMVGRAAHLGYDYLALTDHSPSERIAHGLDRRRLEKKIEEVERLRRKRGDTLPHILMGAEVDILENGTLDYPDDTLARLDVVIAGIHSAFRQSKDRVTRESSMPSPTRMSTFWRIQRQGCWANTSRSSSILSGFLKRRLTGALHSRSTPPSTGST